MHPARLGPPRMLALSTTVVLAAFFTYGCQERGEHRESMASAPPEFAVPAWPPGFPEDFPAAEVTGNLPTAVPQPEADSTPLDRRPYFDYFSWQTFIALNWPATDGPRATPDQPENPNRFLEAASGTPVVWGGFKDSFALFGQGDQRPSAWEASEDPIPACESASAPGAKPLRLHSLGKAPLMDRNEPFSAPLIDQRGHYVEFDIRYNRAQYDFVRGSDDDPGSWLYLARNLAPRWDSTYGVQMPMTTGTDSIGAIMVKAAWRIRTEQDHADRFYSTAAVVIDATRTTCTPVEVLLVGFHIAHKVAPFTEWVWSTFEQVDNVPGATPTPPPPGGWSFFNVDAPANPNGYDYKPPDTASNRRPVQVSRVNAIPTTPAGRSTREINAYYQALLTGTVWQYYQLVVTQYPADPGIGDGKPFMLEGNGGVYPENAGGAFPLYGAVNTTLETYFQTQDDASGAGGNSCMECHFIAGKSDFSWGLQKRAHR